MTYEWSAEDKASSLQQIEEAKSREAFTAELIEDTEKEIAYLKANRTTREMSFTEMAEAYPDLADQVEAELDNREWFKDYIIK
jgi:tRNA A37 threonylcarbamoyladenosine synthetase subunit TsaC/SUA5/YrdC